MSTILTDPALARRLADVLESLGGGKTLDEALDEAGLDKERAQELMRELTILLRRAGGSASRSRPAPAGLKIVAFSDGGSRGNPGPAACAAILYDDGGDELLRRAKKIGTATNNVAEYEGVVLALELAGQLRASDLVLKLDSELIVRQIQGSYKVKNEGLRPYHARAVELIAGFPSFSIEHVRRSKNKEADKLVNDTLDGKES